MSALDRLLAFVRSASHPIGYVLRHPVGARQPLQTVARILWWQASSRLRPGLRPVKWVGGARLLARHSMTGLTGNIYYGLHEFWEMALVALALRKGDLFADIGANAGSYTVLASKVAGAQTVAFEPNAETRELLARNVELNAIAKRVAVRSEAVGDHVGTISFTNDLDTLNHVVDETNAAGCDTVSLTTMDTCFGVRVPYAIKLDIEGGEPGAISGARLTLASPALQILLIETVTAEIERALSDAGLCECTFDPFARKLALAERRQPTSNRLFVRDIDAVSRRISSARPLDVLGIRL